MIDYQGYPVTFLKTSQEAKKEACMLCGQVFVGRILPRTFVNLPVALMKFKSGRKASPEARSLSRVRPERPRGLRCTAHALLSPFGSFMLMRSLVTPPRGMPFCAGALFLRSCAC